MTSINKIISRKHISSGRIEILFEDDSSTIRLGRVFFFSGNSAHLNKVLKMLAAKKSSSILVPDRVNRYDESGRYCFSMPWNLSWNNYEKYSPEELLIPLIELHNAGWLHLDITPDSYKTVNKELKLLFWGDAQISGLTCISPEISHGAAPTVLSDFFLLGKAMMTGREILWDTSREELVIELLATKTSKRFLALEKEGLIKIPFPDVSYKNHTVNSLTGSSWYTRDILVGNWVTKASSNGWLVSVIRCTPTESLRPLPSQYHSNQKINSGAALINCLFPSMSGVERLLVISDIEFASLDLYAIVTEFLNLLPPNLTIVITAGSLPKNFERMDFYPIQLFGALSSAFDLPISSNLIDKVHSGFLDFNGGRTVFRCTAIEPTPISHKISPEELFSEGGYRALISSAKEGLFKVTDNLLAKANFELGNFEDALFLVSQKDVLLKARILLAMGKADQVITLLSGKASDEYKILCASAYINLASPDKAVNLLKNMPGAEAALLYAKALDLTGKLADSLPVIEKAFLTANESNKVKLLCAEVVVFMRIGNYRKALEVAERSVDITKTLADVSLLARSLTERGRVREVTGNWSGAVDDYRLAILYHSEKPGKTDRPPLIDLFVLELRMGELISASTTFKKLSIRLEQSKGGISSEQMTMMLSAYRGVLLGLGIMRVPVARRSAAMAAEKGLTLVHALSLLYLGQLLLQADKYEEGLEALKFARAQAGFMGDRHLVLLVDLAMSRAGVEIDTNRLLLEAKELGLKPEELEAEVICSDDSVERDRAFLEILNMPAPLLACNLASSFGLPEDPSIKKRVLKSFTDICELLDDSEKIQFTKTNSGIVNVLKGSSEHLNTSFISKIIKILATWYDSSINGVTNLAELGNLLGLDYLGAISCGDKFEKQVASSPDLFAVGPDLSMIKMIAPIVASISASSSSPQQSISLGEENYFPEIIGHSKQVLELKATMKRVAEMPVSVLITGATGSGKELVAKGLHNANTKLKGPFVAIDCGAIAETILESELFGVSKGAFTGASETRIGLMEAVNGGTLFLDEIGNMSMNLQVKLLRVLETGKLRRLGDTTERETHFRLVAATNANLRNDSEIGKFRIDLYYRIAVMEIRVPSLCERIEDIPSLVQHFSVGIRNDVKFSREAISILESYHWPGNIRELRNVIQRTVLMCRGKLIKGKDVQIVTGPRSSEIFQLEPLETAISRHISNVVDSCNGNKLKASRILQCDPKTVRKYLSKK